MTTQVLKDIPAEKKTAVIILAAALTVVIYLTMTGCTEPPVPGQVHRGTVDYIDNTQDGGIVSIDRTHGVTIRQEFLDRYNALVVVYGHNPQFLPPILPNNGVKEAPGGLYYLDLEHWSDFLRMNSWHRQGRAAGTPTPGPSMVKRVIDAVIK